MKITIQEVAKKANVSVATVSRVMNGNYPVKEETKEAVLKAVDELNYIPNMQARELTKQKSTTIGVVVPSLSNMFFPEVVNGIENHLKKKGFSIVLTCSNNNSKEEKESINNLIARNVSGIIVVGPRSKVIKSKFYDRIAKAAPLVFINSEYADNNISSVCNDEAKGAEKALNFLIDKKHKDILFVRGEDTYSYDIKEKVYINMLKKLNNLKMENIINIGDGNSSETVENTMNKLIEILPETINNGPNHNHGGTKGFDKVIWNVDSYSESQLNLSYLSKDGEEGYPGNLKAEVTYMLTDENELKIQYNAVCDEDTVVNLTNHSYFNLGGHDSGNILEHKLMVNSDSFTVNDEFSIPTGEIRSVKGTPMDFTELKEIGKDINSNYEQIRFGNGYDHNWMLNSQGDISVKSARVVCEDTGICLDMYTTTPGVQVYTANYLDGSDVGKNNTLYKKRDAVCLEAQFVPNRINNNIGPSTLLKAGEKYNQETIYKFYTL